jgi:uncharacterized protein with NAD-binding domain and iron-sulfur cluster
LTDRRPQGGERVSGPETPFDRPIEVAVIGGGCGAISTAFELSRPEHRGRYHVTVYQMGWRLGGKGASGRGPADRIEEHGLHIWLGFYENAFRLLRECYEELDRDPRECRISDWRDAFYADPHVGVMESSGGDDEETGGGAARTWQPWIGFFSPLEGAPGDPLTDRNPFTLRAYLRRTAELLVNLLRSARSSVAEGPAGGFRDLAGDAARVVKLGAAAVLGGAIHAAELLTDLLETVPAPPTDKALGLLETVSSGVRGWIEDRARQDDELRRIWEILDLVLAILAGVLRFGLLTDPRGLDALDDFECREWLRLNGASESSVNSAFVRGLYDLALAYEDGDVERPALAAGQALRGAARMFFTYRGALFWKMRAGMGDVVFAPFYEVLKRRGVTFEFFHRLENLRLADPEELEPGETPHVEALEFDIQAEVRDTYDPLIDIDGLPCWPAEPRWEQLENGDRLRDEMRAEATTFECFWDRRRTRTKTLRVTEDFDFVVLGVGLGAVPHVARELVERDPRWRDMVEKVKTVASQAFQLWLREDVESLGWEGPPLTVAGFVQPFDTWADMGQLLAEERWPDPPRSIAYFCSVLPDLPGERVSDPDYRNHRDHPRRRREEVRRNAVRFLERDVRHLWPRAVRDGHEERERAPSGGFRWELLTDPSGGHSGGHPSVPGPTGEPPSEARFATQYWTANVNPSDRYVLCPPGSPRSRISPLDNTYDNLTVAGDWTYCGFNEGCVEAAVMSGRLAAHALSGSPLLEDILGYDHP